MADRIYKKRGTYNGFLRTDEPIPKSTFYSKRKLSESQHADDTDDNTSMSAFFDAEENISCEISPHIDEDINFSDLEFDCFNVYSTDYEDNDTNQNDDVKVNLANLNEPLYPSSSHSGERVERGKGFCRIYPLQQPLPEIRSFEQCVNFAEEASLTGKAVHGVKGPTELMKLYPNFDLVQSFVPDYMHAVIL
ncbi:hypothetical protein AVEN_58878-1, partial [Araneus ventricosus]